MISKSPNSLLRRLTARCGKPFPRCWRHVFFVLVMVVAPPLAKTHPVPLEKNVDAAKCLECHEDKTKGKAVHSAIATGCLSCHEVRVNKDVTRIKLTTTTPYKLCLTCHTEKDATQIKGTVHKPAVRDCLTCHDPHTSDFKNQPQKGHAGEEKEQSVLTLPQPGRERSRERQPARCPRHGLRHLSHDAQ